MADNLARIRENIGVYPVKLIAVSKGATPDMVMEAFRSGVTEFGENRVVDFLKKKNEMPEMVQDKIHWHFIGHLQTNKVNKVVGEVTLIHSIDSLRLAQEVSLQAEKKGLVQSVLLQVKMLEDPAKSGFTPNELRSQFAELQKLSSIKVCGLMTISPNTTDATIWHNCFEGLKLLRDELQMQFDIELKELSMGMTQDYEEALACGSTMVRIGRAIFGKDDQKVSVD